MASTAYKNTSLGLPVAIGKQGVKKNIELNLTGEEKKLLDTSVANVKQIY